MRKQLQEQIERLKQAGATYVDALRAGRWRDESVSTDFHELRREFIPADS